MIPTARLQDVAAAFESALSAHFQCSFTPKDESTLHLAIADAFDVVSMGQAKAQELATLVHLDLPRLALPTGDDYLGEFTTTIANTVATPRNWTAPDNAADRIATGAHEVVHVTQHQKGVDAGWWPKVGSHSVLYLCSVATDDAAALPVPTLRPVLDLNDAEAIAQWLIDNGQRFDYDPERYPLHV